MPTGKSANFGFQRHPVWLRSQLVAPPEGAQRYILEVAYAPPDRVALYQPALEGPAATMRAGDRFAFGGRLVDYRLPAFPMVLAPGERRTLYLRVETTGALQVPAFVHPEQRFQSATRSEAYVLGTYYGIFAAIGLYNLLLFT